MLLLLHFPDSLYHFVFGEIYYAYTYLIVNLSLFISLNMLFGEAYIDLIEKNWTFVL